MFLGQIKQMFGQGEEKDVPQVQKPPESEKSTDADEFIRTPEARNFVKEWSAKLRDGKPIYTRRGVTLLLRLLYPSFDSNKKILSAAKELLTSLGGMDGLTGFLIGWKAKSEGIMKGIKNLLGG